MRKLMLASTRLSILTSYSLWPRVAKEIGLKQTYWYESKALKISETAYQKPLSVLYANDIQVEHPDRAPRSLREQGVFKPTLNLMEGYWVGTLYKPWF